MKRKPDSLYWCLSVPALRGFVIHIREHLPNLDAPFVEGLLQLTFQRREVYDVIFDALDEECEKLKKHIASVPSDAPMADVMLVFRNRSRDNRPASSTPATVYPTEEE